MIFQAKQPDMYVFQSIQISSDRRDFSLVGFTVWGDWTAEYIFLVSEIRTVKSVYSETSYKRTPSYADI